MRKEWGQAAIYRSMRLGYVVSHSWCLFAILGISVWQASGWDIGMGS